MKMILSLAPINVNSITLKGTALNVACKKACKNNQKNMIKILINADANPQQFYHFKLNIYHLNLISLKDEEGNTAFDVCEDPDLISLLQANKFSSDFVKITRFFFFYI